MLTLPIKRRWFDLILSGVKLEEYRADTPYYAARFARYAGQKIKVRFRNGYSPYSPSFVATVTPVLMAGGKAEWGADHDATYWTLKIHEIRSGL